VNTMAEQDKKRARARIKELRKIVDAPRLVCDSEDLLPFAWRTPPIVDGKRCTKILREMAAAEELRIHPPARGK